MASFEDELGRVIPQLRRFARSLTRDHGTRFADDLVQETVVLAMRSDRRLSTSPLLWCLGTLVRVHRLRHRKVVTEQRVGGDQRVGAERSGFVSGGALAHASAAAPGRASPCGLDALPLEAREALVLVAVAGLTHAQVAEVLGVSTEIVLARLTDGRDRMLKAEADDGHAAQGSRRVSRGAAHLRLVT